MTHCGLHEVVGSVSVTEEISEVGDTCTVGE